MADKNYLPPFELRKHQITALDKMHNKCVLKGKDLGDGKKEIAKWPKIDPYSKIYPVTLERTV